MKNYITTVRQAAKVRRATPQEWSLLERELAGATTPTSGQDTSEMRRFLAAQTSQVF